MASNYSPLTINRKLGANLRAIQTTEIQGEDARQTLGGLLQSALQLEFATIPTYLSAAFSLTANGKISDLILRAAIEEMLHMTAVANLMNAIGTAPDIVAAVPDYPHHLTVLEPPLQLDLRSFSLDLVKDLFMRIEAPEDPVEFPSLAPAAEPRTIGQFYASIIDIIESGKIPGLFDNAVRDAYKQREVRPNFKPIAYLNNQDTGRYPLKPEIDFRITDKASAVRHLSWVVDQGEGSAPFDPLTSEGLPGHYYRFESIIKSRFLVKDENAQPLGYSFSGGDLPFDPAGVHEFDTNAKIRNYDAFPTVRRQMKLFNDSYTSMINSLHQAFNCPGPDQQEQAKEAYSQALDTMRTMPNVATAIIQKAKEKNIKAGVPFEFTGPSPTS
ncbi:MAG: ferritin-like protein [Bradyrhizobium sp.]|uniref:ferritin-like domain-containing protein n=1 Tax=Bradyrhizobium sp. TaxID=376 RepID=UPI00271936DB|nr:ferritin-like protein [Bradyrhizobium sp.]MDO8396349.1 ferritin-like protein [Bradyrhizobium sp.]